jgi:hypothetical protein
MHKFVEMRKGPLVGPLRIWSSNAPSQARISSPMCNVHTAQADEIRLARFRW